MYLMALTINRYRQAQEKRSRGEKKPKTISLPQDENEEAGEWGKAV